jgi:hypothetical protein
MFEQNYTPDLRFILWSVKKVLLSCTCAVAAYLHVLYLPKFQHTFQSWTGKRTWRMSPAKVSWAGKQMTERSSLLGKNCYNNVSISVLFIPPCLILMHPLSWISVQSMPCIRRGVLWQTGPSLRHQPVVQAILIASVHDTVALCTILPQWRRELDRFCLQIDMHRICLCTLLSKVMNRPNATILNFHVIEQPCFESSLSLSVFDHCWSQLKDVAGCFLFNSGKKPVGVVYTVSS